MKGGESGGGLMEGRECWGWWMSPCVRGEAGTSSVVVAHRLLVACRLLFACRLPVACRLLFACRFLFACHLPIACRLTCRCRPALSMGGGAGGLRLLVVPGPRGHWWLVVWSRRCVVVGW